MSYSIVSHLFFCNIFYSVCVCSGVSFMCVCVRLGVFVSLRFSNCGRWFPVGGGVLEACGSEFKARNSKFEGWTRKDFVVSNHSIVSRSTCEGTRRVHPHARMHPGMPRGVHPVGAPGGCTRRVHPAGAPACPHARMPRGVHPAVPPAGLGFRV